MSERRLKLPYVNVTDAVERFKREGGRRAEELVKLLEDITKWEPERGKKVPGRPFARRIGQKQDFPGQELSGEVFYTFDDSSVIWLLFRSHIYPVK